LAAVASLLIATVGFVLWPQAAQAATTPLPNPPIAKACGIDVTLVLDASGSVDSSHAVGNVRDAATAFLDALADTGSTARVIQFATLAEQLAPRGLITADSIASGGVFGKAVSKYYNPQPQRPSNVEIKRYNGGSLTSSSSFSSANSNIQYTNWPQVLDMTATDPGKLVVFITDGDPTAYNFNRSGDPFTPADVAVGTDRNDTSLNETVDRSVQSANAVKAKGARVLAVGVGSALNNQASVNRLIQVSGPNVARSAAEFDVATTDVALVTNFADLAAAVRKLVLDLCSPSLTIRKFAQSASDATYQPAPGWNIQVTPTVPGGFSWILPPGASGTSATLTTDTNGFAQFQWEPNDENATSSAVVNETLKPDFTAGRPDADDFRCEFKNEAGKTRVVSGELVGTTFTLPQIGNEIGTCALYNSFNYAPEIALTKVNAPTAVRGDLDPPATVTSTYTVTNPGNTPLSNVTVTDDKCATVNPVTSGGHNVGDTNGDDKLDTTETWRYTCVRGMQESLVTPGGVNVVNHATVQGTDPTGTNVTDTAQDDVDVFVPQIALTKQVNGQNSVTVTSGTEVTYTYRATNTGNTPLAPVTLSDDTPPCENPTRGADDPGDGDNTMDPGETWTYSCSASPTSSVVNTATVTGRPLNPANDQPFAGDNPNVTATDTAAVNTVEPGLRLTKTVDQNVVFPGTDVTYTYEATNTGDTDLRNDTGNAGWVADDACTPVEPVPATGDNAGDTNGDGLLNPGETWSFTCTATINRVTLNIATIVAQPVANGNPVGDVLTRHALALVDVVRPAIHLEKTALIPVVLDPDAPAVSGPDVPDPRPAEYQYQVSNTGTVPIRDVALTDDRCANRTLVSGDANSDGILDTDEVWTYTCETTLEREQATPPPGNESGLVTNTAEVTGTPFLPSDPDTTGPQVSDSDTAQVLVIEPSLRLTKTASARVVGANGDVTYTVRVRNTGDVGLQLVGPTDDKCADLAYQSGDRNNNGLLDGVDSGAAETWVFTCTRAVAPVPPSTTDTNTATVTGIDPLGNKYEASDSATVRVITPDINLVKTVSNSLVPAGTTVTYGFDVTNTGTSPLASDDILAQVALADTAKPATPSCAHPTLVSKDGGNQDDLLDREPAETWRYTCAAKITDPTTNIAIVNALGGTQFGLDLPVHDFDAAFVQPFHPAIDVVKTADPTTVQGSGKVTYTYHVRNTGDVPLADVKDRITDDTCSPVTYVSGDTDKDGLLDTPTSIFEDARDETWIFTCTTTIDHTTTNVVTVTGTPVNPTGDPLCGPAASAADAARAARAAVAAQQVAATDLPPCDVTDRDTAVVQIVTPAAPSPSGTATPSHEPSSLAATGSPALWRALVLGLLLVGAGGALALAARRRRPARHRW
jgi:uncharacterized repeat protein (TIGR01451 family)